MTKRCLASVAGSLLLAFAAQTCLGSSARGALLPAGYLSTSGSQFVDQNNNRVRLACVGYDQPGIIDSDLLGMKTYGFNCLRVPWYNSSITSDLAQGDRIVAAASKYGLKIIFDHHGDEAKGSPPYPANGLPFDKGEGTVCGNTCTDGWGNVATVDRSRFISDWVVFARHYAGNATVIGFDLVNEPHYRPATWGDGSATDLSALYQTTGNAILAVNPGALIICEGILNNSGVHFNGSANTIFGSPDLTGADQHPVVLKNNAKLVYSVHDYPTSIGGTTPDWSTAKVSNMNTSWGYLVINHRAPVWVGEMGASLDQYGTDTWDGKGKFSQVVLDDEKRWIKWMVDYLNGGLGLYNGPTFTTCETGISTGWWRWGSFDGQSPDGTLKDGKARPAQQSNTQMLAFIPPAKCK